MDIVVGEVVEKTTETISTLLEIGNARKHLVEAFMTCSDLKGADAFNMMASELFHLSVAMLNSTWLATTEKGKEREYRYLVPENAIEMARVVQGALRAIERSREHSSERNESYQRGNRSPGK